MAGELVPSDFEHGFYEFGGQVAGEIVDLSGSGFNLTVTGATDSTDGVFSNGLSFDGGNDKAVSAQARFADLSATVSILTVYKFLADSTGVDSIYWKGTTDPSGQDVIQYASSGTQPRFRINDGSDIHVGATWGLIADHMVVHTYDDVANESKLSVDGGAFATVAATMGAIRNTGDMVFGATTSSTNYGAILVSQWGITDSILTQDNVNYMWNSGAFRQLGVTVVANQNLLLMGVG